MFIQDLSGRGGPGGHGTRPAHLELPHALRTGGHGLELVRIALGETFGSRNVREPLLLAGALLGLLGATERAPGQRKGAGRANPGELKAPQVSPGFAPRQQLLIAASGLLAVTGLFVALRSFTGASVPRCNLFVARMRRVRN